MYLLAFHFFPEYLRFILEPQEWISTFFCDGFAYYFKQLIRIELNDNILKMNYYNTVSLVIVMVPINSVQIVYQWLYTCELYNHFKQYTTIYIDIDIQIEFVRYKFN